MKLLYEKHGMIYIIPLTQEAQCRRKRSSNSF